MSTRVQYPLTLLLPIKAEAVEALRDELKQPSQHSVLASTEVVHFARLFVFEDNNPAGIPANVAAIITSYDGDFRAYVQAFVDNEDAANFFNKLLSIADVPGAAALIPVTKNAQAFADLVSKYDVTNVVGEPWGQWFSAYPGASVKNIQQWQKNQA